MSTNNSSTLIIFKTKSGASKKYAELLAGKIGAEIFNLDSTQPPQVDQYQRIIFILPTYGGQIQEKQRLEQMWQQLSAKKVYLVVVGMVPQDKNWSKQAYMQVAADVRAGLAGYVKVAGYSPNPEKKPGFMEKLAMKLFLRVDPDTIPVKTDVLPQDLDPIMAMLDE